MELTNYYIRIAELISLEMIGELTSDEEEELGKWISTSSENKMLYEKIRFEIIQLLESQKEINVHGDIAWNRIFKETIFIKKPFSVNTLLKYVAVLFFVVGIFGIGYLQFAKKAEPTFTVNITDTELKPGSQRALLVTSNGSNIELSNEKKDTILERNGLVIENEKNVLTYGKDDSDGKPGKNIEKVIYNTLITPKGGEFSLVLSDGTKIWLNADSRLKYPVKFAGNTREVELEGEAYFEVEKSLNIPFVIKTKQYNVEVLGTHFNIGAYKQKRKDGWGSIFRS